MGNCDSAKIKIFYIGHNPHFSYLIQETGIDNVSIKYVGKIFLWNIQKRTREGGNVDMIIRSENENLVRYADIKVCTGRHEEDNTVWRLEVDFFMNNDSFLILTVRLPAEGETLEKYHFILSSKMFLKLVKREKLEVENNHWVLNIPYSELQKLTSKKKGIRFSKRLNTFRPFFNKWDVITKWVNNSP